MRVLLIVILSIIVLVFALIFFWRIFTHTYIKAEFQKIDPMPPRMEVFFKGYKIGKSTKLKVAKDFKTTYLYISLNQKGLHLPKNITAEIKQYDENIKFVDLVLPAKPSVKYIKSGDVIKGTSRVRLKGYGDLQDSWFGGLETKVEDLLDSAIMATEAVSGMFNTATDILNQNRQNVYEATSSLRHASKNLENVTENLEIEVSRETIRNSTKNIEIITGNFAKSSDRFYVMSGSLDKSSAEVKALVKNTNTLVDIAKMALCNLNDIILGFKETLRKKLGGARLLFKQNIP